MKKRLVIKSSILGAATAAAPVFCAPASAHLTDPTPTPTVIVTRSSTPRTVIIVKAGDNLSAIAKEVGRTWPQLAGWNHLTDPNFVYQNERLRIPPASYQPPRPAPPTYVATTSVAPAAGTSFEACVIYAESRGDPNAWNPNGHWGAFQFSYSTWVANGGVPTDYGHASFAEQESVFQRSSPSNWAPYDGC